MNIEVSVIVPVYNMERYLPKCLNSILNQTLQEIEIICINDGSTDNTENILKEYRQKYSNIIVLQQERAGAGVARNKGIKNAKGKFLAFMDPDDYYPSDDVLETLIKCAIEHGVQAAGGNCQIEFEGILHPYLVKRFDEDRIISFFEYQDCIGFTKFIYSSEMLKENEIVFPSYVRAQDPIFMLKALSCAGKIWIMTKDIYVVRVIDKKIRYNSTNVIYDLAKGLYDVIHFSKGHNYNKIIEDIILSMMKWKIYFFLHILNGHQELYDCLKKMNSDVLASGYCKDKQYYLDISVEDMNAYISKYAERIRGYVQIMKKYEKIVIYGAGKIGKTIFDVIEQREYLNFCGFAVSRETPEGKARGEKIYCIDKYIDVRDTALVVIAGEKRVSDDMEKTAKKLGFKNRLIINEEIIDVDNFEIVNDRFAV